MTGLMQVALSGLQKNAHGLLVVAHNIANVKTDGFRSQRPDPDGSATTPRYEEPVDGVLLEPEGLPPSDVDLATELVDLKRFEIGYRANATMLGLADRLLGELLDVLA